MPLYNYIVKDSAGKNFNGTVDAPNIALAGDILRERKYIVISLTEKREGGLIHEILQRFRGVKIGEKTIFASQLAVMVSAGLPIADALEIMRGQTQSGRMREVMNGMLNDIQGGSSLAKSMAKYPDVFNNVTVSLVEAGEASGKLDVLLDQLAKNTEKERDFQSKTRGALIYPAVIGVAMVAVLIVMMIFVVPELTVLYEEIGKELPLPTRIVIGISKLLLGGWWAILVLFGLIGFGLFRYLQTEKGKYQIARLTFNFPIFGKLNKESEVARFARTLGLLVGAGVPITQSLEIVASAMGNILYRDALLKAVKQVEKGVPLSVPIRNDPNFDPLVTQMIALGEETGKLDEMMSKLAGFFESQAEQSVKNLSAAIEPVILVILGVMVGGLILAIIAPIYNLTAQF